MEYLDESYVARYRNQERSDYTILKSAAHRNLSGSIRPDRELEVGGLICPQRRSEQDV